MAGFSGATGVPKKYVDDAIAQSTAKNFQTGTYVATHESVVQANANTTLMTATVTKTGRYIIIGFFGASSESNAISLIIAVNGNTIRSNWKSFDKSISSISTLTAGDVVTLIANTTKNETFYRDVRNNNLLIAEI